MSGAAIMKRARQPSTWAGIAALVALFSPEAAQAIQVLGTAVPDLIAGGAALVAVVMNEAGDR